MSIAKLKLFNLTSNTTDLDQVLTKFVDLTWLHPVPSYQVADKVHGLAEVVMDNPYIKVLNTIKSIEKTNNFEISENKIEKTTMKFKEMEDYINTFNTEIQKYWQQKNDTIELIKKYQDALTQVTHIENLDISFDDVFSCQYVNVRVGIMPVDSIDKLQLYQFKPFLFKSFNVENGNCWCIYFSTEEYKEDIDNIFKSLFFRRIHIPDFVHGTPKNAEITLLSEMDVANESLKEINEQIAELLKSNLAKLTETKSELTYLSKIYEAKKFVVTTGDKISITGFVEEKQIDKLNEIFAEIKSLKIQFRPPDSDKRLVAPTKLKNAWFTRPFSMFVEMYGVPGYHDIDPTAMVAITYCLLFGIMFGDLGQGLLLALFGFILYKWKGSKLGAVGIRIGISSAFFGLLYGSFFGDEQILLPLFQKFHSVFGFMEKPLRVMDSDFTMNILISTVAIGSMLIFSAMIMNIITSFRKKDLGELLFSHNGVAGMIFYIFVVGGLFLNVALSISIFNIFTELIFGLLPLLLIMFKGPLKRKIQGQKMFPDKLSDFFVDGFFELFEVVLSYVTNTMSFLRVGGFVLAHAGLMLVVFSIMDMSSSFVVTSIIFVFGNLLVMALEGLIVGIQVLRLEFYEMFSRYFEGNGIPFKPYM